MNDFKKIISKILIENLGIEANMLSRIEGDNSLCIELHDGSNIFLIYEEQRDITILLEVSIRDMRSINIHSSKIINFLINDEQLSLNIKADKLIVYGCFDINSNKLDEILLDKLVSFNNISKIFH